MYDLPWLDVEELCDLMVDFMHRAFGDPAYGLTYIQEDNVVTLMRENGYSMLLDYDANTITSALRILPALLDDRR